MDGFEWEEYQGKPVKSRLGENQMFLDTSDKILHSVPITNTLDNELNILDMITKSN